jgi:uncharacterized membrane protein YdjX (TVP38/TMEM64 family)
VAGLDALGRPAAARWGRVVLLLGAIAGLALLARLLGVGELFRPEALGRLKEWIAGYGAWAPVLFILGYAVAELCFVPALPLTLLGGLVFGPVRGTAYVSAGATLGAALAFLAARYAARGLVEGWVRTNPRLARIDAAVAEHGWRILMITRLVPLFPFNLQNFAYGLTRLPFRTFVGLSWLCMLPGTAAFALAGSALAEGPADPRRALTYAGLAGVLIVAVSLLPRWLRRRSRLAGELVGSP